MSNLTNQQKKTLKSLAHALNPTVIVGNKGLSDGLLEEAAHTIEHHELIKVKIQSDDREERQALAQDMSQRLQAELIQTLGKTAVLFKQRSKDSAFNL